MCSNRKKSGMTIRLVRRKTSVHGPGVPPRRKPEIHTIVAMRSGPNQRTMNPRTPRVIQRILKLLSVLRRRIWTRAGSAAGLGASARRVTVTLPWIILDMIAGLGGGGVVRDFHRAQGEEQGDFPAGGVLGGGAGAGAAGLVAGPFFQRVDEQARRAGGLDVILDGLVEGPGV